MSYLHIMDLGTYPFTYFNHFGNISLHDNSIAISVLLGKRSSQKTIAFSHNAETVLQYFDLALEDQVLRLHHGPIWLHL